MNPMSSRSVGLHSVYPTANSTQPRRRGLRRGEPPREQEQQWFPRCLLVAVITHVLEDQDASVINIASIYGLVSPHLKIYQKNNINPPFYGASKAALIQWTRYAAVEFADKGIRFNSVCPGPFPSQAAQTENPKLMKEIIKNVPLGRLGKSSEIVSSLLFLASSGSSYVTGSNITVDGGWTSW